MARHDARGVESTPFRNRLELPVGHVRPEISGYLLSGPDTWWSSSAFVWWIAHNTAANLARSNTASGFGFLRGRAGFEIGQSLIPFSSDSTYGRALLVGILNTLLVASPASSQRPSSASSSGSGACRTTG
jgi:hypothetical protein